MPPTDPSDAELLQRLQALAAQADTPASVRALVEATLRTQPEPAGPLSIVLLGEVGAGKTSLLTRLTDLLVTPAPQTSAALNEAAVLPTGVGRITLCEVVVEASEGGQAQLLAEPMPYEVLKQELTIWAEDLFQLAHPRPDGPSAVPSSRELDKALRGLLVEKALRRPTAAERAAGASGMIDPALNAARAETEGTRFVHAILAEARLEGRYSTKPQPLSLPDLPAIKQRIRALHQGELADEAIPERLTLRVAPRPNGPFWSLAAQLQRPLRLIDSRGLDGDPTDRDDLAPHLADPRAVLLLCCPFKAAPGAYLRPLCGILRPSGAPDTSDRLALVVVDTGDSAQVEGAEGDPAFGQELKKEEVMRALRADALTAPIGADRVAVVNALRDDLSALLRLITDRVQLILAAERQAQAGWRAQAEQVLRQQEALALAEARLRLDERLLAAFPAGVPLTDPMELIAQTVASQSAAQTVMATARRRGVWKNLNVYQRLRADAFAAATRWLGPLHVALAAAEVPLASDALTPDPRQERRSDLHRFTQRYADDVMREVQGRLQTDRQLWNHCKEASGAGQILQVADALRRWGRANSHNLHSHLRVRPELLFPGLVARRVPPAAPTLVLRNLRRARQSTWTIPRDISLLIGPNGSGKTTLLRSLRFLHLALERNPTEALQLAFDGARTLRSRIAPDTEPVEIALSLGEAHWSWSFWPRGDAFRWTETVSQGADPLFTRDLSGVERRAGVETRPNGRCGLWNLRFAQQAPPAVEALAQLVENLRVHGDLDIVHLREEGSDLRLPIHPLDRRGHQALALLQGWKEDPREQERFDFVVESLRSAFPQDIETLGRSTPGNPSTLLLQVFPPNSELPSPLADQASGFLQSLLVLTAIAAVEPGGVVLIDDPETGLHPFAERQLLAAARDWAQQRQIGIVFATHSTILLNDFGDRPELVFLTQPDPKTGALPCALPALFSDDWLARFALGDRQEENFFGTNEGQP